jgi:hypothetical protein
MVFLMAECLLEWGGALLVTKDISGCKFFLCGRSGGGDYPLFIRVSLGFLGWDGFISFQEEVCFSTVNVDNFAINRSKIVIVHSEGCERDSDVRTKVLCFLVVGSLLVSVKYLGLSVFAGVGVGLVFLR